MQTYPLSPPRSTPKHLLHVKSIPYLTLHTSLKHFNLQSLCPSYTSSPTPPQHQPPHHINLISIATDVYSWHSMAYGNCSSLVWTSAFSNSTPPLLYPAVSTVSDTPSAPAPVLPCSDSGSCSGSCTRSPSHQVTKSPSRRVRTNSAEQNVRTDLINTVSLSLFTRLRAYYYNLS